MKLKKLLSAIISIVMIASCIVVPVSANQAIYTEANGWELPVSDSGAQATELEDGRLQLNNTAIFKPTLEAGKKYSIKYNVTDLAIEAGSWTFPFRVKMTAGGVDTDGILAYRMANVWEARNLVVASGTGTNEIIIDTKAKTWEAYALGSLSQYGTVESFDDFALTFYKWGGPSASIGNVTVEDITSDEVFYEQNFDQIGAEFSNWRAATVAEVRATQPLQVWSGSFETTGEDKQLLSGAMDIYPLAVTPKAGNYLVNFDIKPNAISDPNGSNWEGIVMQWNLGSSNADSWHDMKIGTSAGANAEGEVAIDRLWIFGQEMTIDPTQWININLEYNCNSGKITAKATQGATAVEATAPFSVNASSLTGSPKITFEGIKRNEVNYDGVYLDNIEIKKGKENAIYNTANGWTLPESDDGSVATELEDGRLQINNKAIFKPTLEADKKYSIKYNVTDLAIEAGSWTFPFRVKMTAGGVDTDGILAYRMANVWEARNLVVASGTGTNEIIIDTKAKTWEAYALGSLSQYGTVDSFDDFALTFYKWGGPSASIGNVTVEDITSDEVFYEQNFDQIGAEFSNWRAATVAEVRATQPLQVWSGSFETTGEDKQLLSGAMDIYPLAVTPKTDNYEVSFDIKPKAATDPNGSNWEGIVMQWNLGSSNADSWHDMKIGTSQGASVSSEVAIDRLWIFGQEMTIDPTQWININLEYNCNSGKITAKATQGATAVEATAPFSVNTSSLTGSPKVTFEGLTRNEVKYEGVYLDNIEIKKEKENAIYNTANGWTLPESDDGSVATELEDGRLQINNTAIFKPTLEAGKKYSIKYNVTDLAIEAGSWTFPFRVKMTAGGVDTDGILAYRMANVWEARNLVVASGTGTNEIIIDTKAKTWEAYALGSLSKYGTVESFDDFALTFYKWGGPSASIGNVTVEDITSDEVFYEQNFDQIGAEFSNWRAATVAEVRATQPLQVWSGSFETTGEDKQLLSGAMDIYPLAVTPKTDNYEVSFDIKPKAATDPNGSNWEGIVMQWNLGSSNADSWHDMKIGTSAGANAEGEVAIDRLWIFGQEMVIDPSQWINVKLVYICSSGTIEARITQGNTVVTASAPFTVNTSSLTGSPKVTFEGIKRNEVTYDGVYLDNIAIKKIEVVIPVIYTPENGWVLLEDGMGAREQEDGSLKIGKGKANAAQFTPNLEYGKAYEITYDVGGLEVVSGSWKKPFTVTLSSGGQTESDVLTYRMAGAWRNLKTDVKYASGSNGTNKIIIDTASGEWEAYALGEKATYSGHTTIMNGSSKTYYEFSDTSDFTISFYAYDTSSDFTTPYISNVKITEIAPTDYTNEGPILANYKIKANGTAVDSPIGLSNFDVELNFKPEARKSGMVTAMVGVYDSQETFVGSGYETKTIKATDNSVVINVSLDAPYTTGNICKVFVWDGTGSLRPLVPVIYPTEKISLNKVADNAELHNDLMAAYLNDSYENVAEYAWGGMDKDDPKPVDFEWAASNDYSSYTLEISENEDMSDAREIVTNKNSCEVYNLKVGTRYYWRVKATDENGVAVTSSVSTFTTKEGAPRYIQVAGLTNGRDVGGWTTASGKKVKQGMIYRSYCFDYVKDDKTVTLVTSEGIDTLVNTLGIKTEIDLRGESEKTSSILGEGVNYYRFGMNYEGDLMSGNKETIKNVFNIIADNLNYPIIWHCQAGADRTGVMTYLLNGLLGVEKEDLLRDYLLTNFAINDNSSRELAGIESKYVKTLDEYEGSTLSEKIYNYLNVEIGISTENLNKIRDNMIE